MRHLSSRLQAGFRRFAFLFLSCLWCSAASAQVSITTGGTATILAQALAGDGVTVSSATLTCPTGASGLFTAPVSALGIDSGVLLTSGRAVTVGSTPGVDAAASLFASQNHAAAGDASLATLTGLTTYDACVLEFDFIPSGDSIHFQYKFGSEEYPEYACSGFNDVFGFFISGPGFSGAQNIALVPGTNIPVAINSVNSAPTGTTYAVSGCNAMGTGSPFSAYYINNSASTQVVYDGTTTILTAKAAVTPCTTYHLKLAVSDAGDGAYDSGVFLEGNSLTSGTPGVLAVGGGGLVLPTQHAIRGCMPGQFNFTRPYVKSTPITLKYEIVGTAVNGTDYTFIPDSVIIPAFSTVASRTISPLVLPSGPTGPRVVKIRLQNPYVCGSIPVYVDSAELLIVDSIYAYVSTPDTLLCPGTSIIMMVDGDSALSYSWSPSTGLSSSTARNPVANPATTTTYTLTVNFLGSTCPPVHDTVTIERLPPIDASVVATPICAGTPLGLLGNPTIAGATYSWTGPSGFTSGLQNPSIASATPAASGVYNLTVSKGGCSLSDTTSILVKPMPVISGAAASGPVTCGGTNGSIALSGLTPGTTYSIAYTGPSGSTTVSIAADASGVVSITGLPAGTYGAITASLNGCTSASAGPLTLSPPPTPAAPTASSATYCEGAATTALSASGVGLLWYTAPTGGVGSGTAPLPSAATPGTATWYVSQTVAGCESPRTAVTVIVNPKPAAPTVSGTYTFCQGGSGGTLSATGTGLLWYTAATGGTGTSAAPVISTAVPDTTVWYVSQTSAAGCEGPRTAITVKVNPLPVLTVSPAAATVCNGTPSSITASGATSYSWTPSTGLSITTGPTVTATPATTTTYIVTGTSAAGCSTTATSVITVNPIPVATASSSTPVCAGSTLNLYGTSTVSGSAFSWTGPGGYTSTLQNPTIASATTAAAGTYTVTASAAGCTSTAVSTAMVVNPTKTTSTTASICPGASVVLGPTTISSAGTYTHTFSTTKGCDSVVTMTVSVSSVTNTAVSAAVCAGTSYTFNGTTYSASGTYTYTTTAASGCDSVVTLSLTVHPATPAPTAAIAYTYCQSATAATLTATGTSLLWYTAPTGGTGSTTAPTPATTSAGTTTWYVSQTLNGCEGPRTAIAVTVNPTPAAPTATSSITYCQAAPTSPLSATGTGLLWYTSATGGTGSSTAPTPSSTTAGTTTWYVSQTVLGCESPRTPVTVNITPLPAAPWVTSPVAYCQGATAPALSATGTSLLWYTAATGGTGAGTAPTPVTATAGTTTYYVSQTVSGCEGPRAAITMTINPLPAAPAATAPPAYCIGTTAAPLSASGVGLLWYTSATGGTGSSTAPTPSTASAGTTTWYVSQTSAAGCEGPRTAVSVTVNPTPAAPTVTSPVVICEAAPALALTATGTSLLWYTTATGGTGTSAAPTPSTTTPGSTTWYVSQSALGCEGPRAPITVTITPLPLAPTAAPVSLCQGATAAPLAATGTSLLWYTTATGGTGSATAPTPGTASAGTTTYYVSQTVSGCEGPRAAVTVTMLPLPAAPTVTPPSAYCQDSLSAPLSASGTGLLWYTSATGGTGTSATPTPITTMPGTMTWYVSQTVSGCEGPRTPVSVTVNATPAAPVATPAFVYCAGETAAPLSATGMGVLWYTTGVGGTGSFTAPTPSTATAGVTTYYATQTVAGCESPRTAITVTVHPLPLAPSVTSPVVYCEDAPTTALTAVGTALGWYTVSSGGSPVPFAPVPSSATAGSTTWYVSQTAFGCEGPRAPITVTVNPKPVLSVAPAAPAICAGQTQTLTAIGAASYSWSPATGLGGTATGAAVSAAPTSTTTYAVTGTTALGCVDSTTLTLTVNPVPVATATSSAPVCAGSTLALSGSSTVSGSSFSWTGPGGYSSTAASPAIGGVTTAASGTYTLTATAAGCTSTAVSTAVVVNPTKTTSTAAAICPGTAIAFGPSTISGAGTYTHTFNTTAGCDSVVTLTVSVSSTATYTTTTAICAGTSYTFNGATYSATGSYADTFAGSNGCDSAAVLALTVYPPTTAPTVASSTLTYCQSDPASALSATGSNLLWYTTATGGTGSAAAPTPGTATAGTITYYVSQTLNGCEGPRTTITVTVNPTPTAPTVTTPVTYCQGATASALTASGSGLLWAGTTTGTGSSTPPTPSTAAPGSTTYYVTQTVLGCVSPAAPVAVNVTPLPAAPSVTTPVVYCQGAPTAALSASGASLAWYSAPSGGTPLLSAPTPLSAMPGTTTWYVSQTVSGCEGPTAAITATTNPTPVAAINGPDSLCDGDVLAFSAASTLAGTGFAWSGPGGYAGSGATPSSGALSPSASGMYTMVASLGACADTATAALAVLLRPTLTLAATQPATCGGTGAIAVSGLQPLLSYTFAYTFNGTAQTYGPAVADASGAVTVSSLAIGTYGSFVSSATGTCSSYPSGSVTLASPSTPATPAASSNSPVCDGATLALSTAAVAGAAYNWSGPGGWTSTLQNPTIPASLGAGGTYTVTVTIAGCTSAGGTTAVVVNPLPTVVASSNGPVCEDGTLVMTATGSTGASYVWNGPGGWTAAGTTGTVTAVTPSMAGLFTVTSTLLGCVRTDTETVVINALPAAPVATPVGPYCPGAAATAVSATGSGLLWYTSAAGGTGLSSAPVPSTLAAGSTTWYVSQTVSGCEGPRDSMTVVVNPTPAAPGVTTPYTYCEGTPATALVASGSGVLWYSAPTGAGAPTAPTPSTVSAGTATWYATQTILGCESAPAAVTVTVIPLPVAPVVSPVTLCQGATATPLTASGASLAWYTTAAGGTPLPAAPTPSTTTPGTTTWYVSQAAIGCEGPRTSITVDVTPLPLAPSVTTPVVYCQSAAATALTAAGASLLWYPSAAGGTGAALPPVPSTAFAGTTTWYVSQTVAGCEGPRDSVSVTVNPMPAAPAATSPYVYCEGVPATALTATGSDILWYTSAAGGTGTPVAPTPSTTASGSATWYATQTILGCESPATLVTVDVTPLPLAPTVTTPVVYCEGSPATALMASGASLAWYTAATGGTGSTTAPVPGTTTAGSTTWYVSQTAIGCEGPRTAITVDVTPLPAPPSVVSPVVHCQTSAAPTLTASGTDLLWYTSATGGTGTAASPTPSTATAGSTTWYVSQTVNGCEGPRVPVTVNITPLPAAPAVAPPAPYCQDSASLPLSATGTSLLWYTSATGGTGSAITPTPGTSAPGTATWYVSQTVAGCEGPRAPVSATVNPTPALPAVISPITYCQASATAPLSAAGMGLLWYTSATGGTGTTIAPTPSSTTAGSTTWYVSQTAATGCEGPRAPVTVAITPLPAAPAVAPPLPYCQGASAVPLTATGSGLLWYTSATGGAGISTAPTPPTTTPGTTTWYVSQTVSGCEGPRTPLSVQTLPLPALPTAATPLAYCTDEVASPLTASGTGLLWYTSAAGGTGSTTAPTPPTTTPGITTWYVTQTVGYCESPRTPVTVEIKARPAAPATAPLLYCQNAPAVPLTATGTGLRWYNTMTGGTALAYTPTPNTSVPGTTTWYVSQTTVGCEGARAAVTVTVMPEVVASFAAAPDPVCQYDTATITFTGLADSTASYTWSFAGGTVGSGAGAGPYAVRFDTVGTKMLTLTVSNAACRDSVRMPLMVKDAPEGLFALPHQVCLGEAATLAVVAAGTVWGGAYTWDLGGGTVASGAGGSGPMDILWDTPGDKVVTMFISANGCAAPPVSDTISVRPLPVADILLPLPTDVCTSDTLTFEAAVDSSAIRYTWTPSAFFRATGAEGRTVEGQIHHNATVRLTVLSEYGCEAKDSVNLLTHACCNLFIPNAFTPNGDGRNDVFRAITEAPPEFFNLRVYNRWGQIVWSTTQPGHGWDGVFDGIPQDVGTYQYLLTYICAGTGGVKVEEKGDVTLIR